MSWKLTAFKYYYIPLKEIGLGGILVEPTADMIRLQGELFDATGKFFGTGQCRHGCRLRDHSRRIPKLTRPPSMRLRTTFPRTAESITAPCHHRRRHGRLSGCLARCAVSTFTFSAVGVRLPVRQLRNGGETASLLRADAVRLLRVSCASRNYSSGSGPWSDWGAG